MRRWIGILLMAGVGRAFAGPVGLEAWSLNVEPLGFEQTGDGIAPGFIRYLSESADVPMEVAVRPYLRVIEGLRNGQNSMTLMIPTAEREKLAFVLCQPASVQLSILYRRDAVKTASAASDLAGYRIGILRGSEVLAGYAASAAFQTSLVNTQEQGVRMMLAGRLDGTLCSHPGCNAALRSLNVDRSEFGEVLLGEHPMAIMVSRASSLASDVPALRRLRIACRSKEGQRVMSALLKQWD